MNRWSRIVWTLSLLAGAGWIAGGWAGYEVRDGATLAHHTLLVFGALLALVLTHGWVAIYLVALERLLSRSESWTALRAAAFAKQRRRGAGAVTLAIGAAVTQFAVSNALFPGRLAADWHALGAFASAAVLTFAAVLEWRALVAAGRLAETIAA